MSLGKIYVDAFSEFYRAAYVADGELTELILQDKNESIQADNIYTGRVEKVLPSGIAFVNIGYERPVFLQLNDSKEVKDIKNIKPGQEITVQIIKEAYDEKCAVATSALSLAGKYAVVIKSEGQTGVSSKITDSAKRQELKAIGDKYRRNGIAPIIRTSAQNAEISEVENELNELCTRLTAIIEKGGYTKAPALIYSEYSPLDRAIRDMADEDCTIVTNDRENYENFSKRYKNTVLYEGNIPIFRNFSIEKQIDELYERKVWLKNGGYIVIDETEAMTVIDVNSGKATESRNYARINMEACEEIARQIRLRNIGGMIIADFINIKNRSENERLLEHMEKCIQSDRVKVHIVGMTELGLMQLTRQKKRKPLSRYIFHSCPYCNGTGHIRNISCICDNIKNQTADIFASTIFNRVKISANEEIISHLKQVCSDIEKLFNKKIEYNIIRTSRFDYYEIDKIKE